MGHAKQDSNTQDQIHRVIACEEGARVGRLGLSLEHNPYRHTDPLHAEWCRCWQSEIAAHAQRAA